MLDSGLLWLAKAIDAQPRRIAVACLLATLLAAIVVIRIPVTTDILDVMPDNTPAIIAFTDFLRDFGILGGLVVVVEARDEAADTLVAVVEALGEQLSVSPYVESVDYNLLRSGFRLAAEHFPIYLDARGIAGLAERLTPAGIRSQMQANRDMLLSPLASPLEAEAIRRDPLNIRQLVQAGLRDRLPAQSLDLSTGYYLDRSHTLAFLMVRPKGSTRDMSFVRGLQREMRRIAARVVEQEGSPRNVTIGFAGGFARAAEAASVIWRDMVVSFAVALVLVLLILYVAFRPSAVVVGTFVVTLLAALVWTLLLAYVLYGTLNIVTSIVSAMLIGLFVDYMINTYKRFNECYRLCGNSLQALEKTLTGTGKAIVSGALTTAVSFFSVVITSFRGMHELGVVAGFGILFCLAATLVLMTSILVWLAQSWPACFAAVRPADLGATWMAGVVERHRTSIMTCFAVLLLFGGMGTRSVGFDATVDSLGLRNSGVQATEEKVQQVLGRRGEPLFSWRARRETMSWPRILMRWSSKGNAGAETARSAAFLPQGRCCLRLPCSEKRWRVSPPRGSRRRARVPSLPPPFERRCVATVWSRTTPSTPTRQGSSAPSGRGRWLLFQSSPRAQDPRSIVLLQSRPKGSRGAPDAARAGLEPDRAGGTGRRCAASGGGFPSGRRRQVLGRHPRDHPLGGRGGRVALVCCQPMHHGAPFQELASGRVGHAPCHRGNDPHRWGHGHPGIAIQFLQRCGASLLIFGFGVDYGIYLMQAYIEEPKRAGSNAVQSVGGVIILCAVTTVVSCGSLVTTHYRGLASIGTVLCLGALFCLASTLLLLPSLLGSSGKAGAAS